MNPKYLVTLLGGHYPHLGMALWGRDGMQGGIQPANRSMFGERWHPVTKAGTGLPPLGAGRAKGVCAGISAASP